MANKWTPEVFILKAVHRMPSSNLVFHQNFSSIKYLRETSIVQTEPLPQLNATRVKFRHSSPLEPTHNHYHKLLDLF